MILGLLWLARVASRLVKHGSWWIGERTEADLAQLFVFVTAKSLLFWTLMAVAVVVAAGTMLHIAWPLVLALVVAAAIGPRIFVATTRHSRQRRLAAQLPDAMALWAGLLRSGQGVTAALSQVASRQPNPLGAELRLVLAEHRLGMALGSAISALRDRVG